MLSFNSCRTNCLAGIVSINVLFLDGEEVLEVTVCFHKVLYIELICLKRKHVIPGKHV